MAKQGMRGTGDMQPNQRPTNFGKGVKMKGGRVSREDVEKMNLKKPMAPPTGKMPKGNMAPPFKKKK